MSNALSRPCRLARLAWNEGFDCSRPLPVGAEQHLSECAGCQSYLAASETLRASLRTLPAPEQSSYRVADAALLSQLRADRQRPLVMRWLQGQGWGDWRLAGAGVASFMLMLGLGAWVSQPSAPAEPAPQATLVSPSRTAALPGVSTPETSPEDALDHWLTTGRRWPAPDPARQQPADLPRRPRLDPRRGAQARSLPIA